MATTTYPCIQVRALKFERGERGEERRGKVLKRERREREREPIDKCFFFFVVLFFFFFFFSLRFTFFFLFYIVL